MCRYKKLLYMRADNKFVWDITTRRAEEAFQNALAEFFIALNKTEGYDLDKCVNTIRQYAYISAYENKDTIKFKNLKERM